MRVMVFVFLAIGALFVHGRVIKRQKKITRIIKPSCARQQSVIDLPSPKSLLETACSCLGSCGCQTEILVEELPFACNVDSYRIQNAEESTCDRVTAIRLPKIPSIDPNQLALYQSDVSNCQCQNPCSYLYDSCKSEFLSPIDVLNPRMPVEIIQTVIFEPLRSVVTIPNGYQMPVECCQRQKCGCQLRASDVPCSCQIPVRTSCGCTLSSLDMPCCQIPPFNLPCGCQLPGLDCGCQFQAFNSPCGCQLVNGCQLPAPNVPYSYQLSDRTCGYQLPVLDGCGCQLPNCGCQIPPPGVGCKYLRQVTLQAPSL